MKKIAICLATSMLAACGSSEPDAPVRLTCRAGAGAVFDDVVAIDVEYNDYFSGTIVKNGNHFRINAQAMACVKSKVQ